MNTKELARIREQTAFLGYEFLTWLLLALDSKNSHVQMQNLLKDTVFKTDCALVLGNRVVTCLLNHKEQKTSIVTPLLEESYEVFASLKNGHVVEALALSLSLGEISIAFMLHASDFAFTQIKLKNNFENMPTDDEGLDEEDQAREDIFLRLSALRDMEAVVNALWAHFLTIRLEQASFKEELACMLGQVDKSLHQRLRKESESSVGVSFARL